MSQHHQHVRNEPNASHHRRHETGRQGPVSRVRSVLRTPDGGFAKTPWVLAVNVFILMIVAGGATAYAALSTTVELTVEGKTQTIRTFGSTVEDVLEARDIELAADDRINVATTARIDDDTAIEVAYAKPVSVTIDGTPTEEIAYEPTVGDLLERHGVEPTKGDFVSKDDQASIPRKGLEVVVSTTKNLTVVHDGQTQALTTSAPTVAEVLEEAGITVDADDEIAPGLDTLVTPDAALTVVRIEKDFRTEEVDVPFETVVTEDADKPEGETSVTTPGVVGKAREKVDVVTADGQIRERVVVEREVLSEPVTQAEVRGTKKAPAATNFATGDSVFDQLAQCESGGNWAANTGNGYYGGVQFSAQTWRAMGGSGLPSDASREEQIQRASALQAQSGWGQWPSCAKKLGLL